MNSVYKKLEEVLTAYYDNTFEEDLKNANKEPQKSRLTAARYYLEFMIPKQQTTTMRPETGKVDEATIELTEFDKQVLKIIKNNPADGTTKD